MKIFCDFHVFHSVDPKFVSWITVMSYIVTTTAETTQTFQNKVSINQKKYMTINTYISTGLSVQNK